MINPYQVTSGIEAYLSHEDEQNKNIDKFKTIDIWNSGKGIKVSNESIIYGSNYKLNI